MKILVALLLGTVGCGARVALDIPADAAIEETADTAIVDTFVPEAPPEKRPVGDASGTYLMGCMPSLLGGDVSKQFVFRVDLVRAGSKVDFRARAFLETASVFSSELLTGPTLAQD